MSWTKTKSYIEMSKKEKIANDCGGTQLIDDVNHPVRRYFRCWLDGSYHDEATYNRNCDYITKNHDNYRRMRSFIIRQFTAYTAYEYNVSFGYAQECIVACITEPTLEHLNDLLIDDALDLIEIPQEEE
mgnify:CR=1 FL=1